MAELTWTITSPDGRQWAGSTAYQAANLASAAVPSERAAGDRAGEALLLAELHAIYAANDLDLWAHLNCPACGGSGHIGDTRKMRVWPRIRLALGLAPLTGGKD